MRNALFALAIVVGATASAHAGRPGLRAARCALDQWGGSTAALPFRVHVEDGGSVACDSTITDRTALATALTCVRDHASFDKWTPWKSWSRKLAALAGEHAEIAKLARTARVFVSSEANDDASYVTVVAIAKDSDGTLRVIAVFAARHAVRS
jgi:hypothetical protein